MNTTTIRKNADFLKDALGQVNTQFQQVRGGPGPGGAYRVYRKRARKPEQIPFAQGIALGQSSLKLVCPPNLEKMAQVVQSAKEQVEALKKGNEAEAGCKANKRIAN